MNVKAMNERGTRWLTKITSRTHSLTPIPPEFRRPLVLALSLVVLMILIWIVMARRNIGASPTRSSAGSWLSKMPSSTGSTADPAPGTPIGTASTPPTSNTISDLDFDPKFMVRGDDGQSYWSPSALAPKERSTYEMSYLMDEFEDRIGAMEARMAQLMKGDGDGG